MVDDSIGLIDELKKSEDSLKEIKKKQHKKELKSLRNKMSGDNLMWFSSLTEQKQYDFLFQWKGYKHYNTLEKVEIGYRYEIDWTNYSRKKRIPVKKYPPSLKHYIKSLRKSHRYRISTSKKRDTIIDTILNEK